MISKAGIIVGDTGSVLVLMVVWAANFSLAAEFIINRTDGRWRFAPTRTRTQRANSPYQRKTAAKYSK